MSKVSVAPPWQTWQPPDLPDDGLDPLPSEELSPGILPFDLGRRGFWALEPGQQVQLQMPIEDVMGTILVWDAPLGRISVADMQVAIALAAIWGEGERERVFSFMLSDLAARLEFAWGGKTAKQLDRALVRLRSTTFGITWRDPENPGGEHDDRFGILDSFRLSGRRGGARVKGQVEWSRWTYERLSNRSFSLIDLPTLKSIDTWMAKRLYAYCETMSGHPYRAEDGEAREMFRRRVDEGLKGTLGCRGERDLRFLRRDLKRAGEMICQHDSRYRRVEIQPGRSRGSWLLVVDRLKKK